MKDNWTDKLPSLLEGYEEAAPEGLWDAVRAGAARPKVIWWPWAAGVVAAAAAVVLAVFLWRPAPSAIPSTDVPFGDGLLCVPSERLVCVSQESGPVPVAAFAEPVWVDVPVEADTLVLADTTAPQPDEPDMGATAAHQENPSPSKQVLPENKPFRWSPEGTAPRKKPGRVEITVTSGGFLLAQAPGTVTKSYGVAYNPGMGNTVPVVKGGGITTQMLSRNRETTTEASHRRFPRISVEVSYEFAPRWSVGTGITYSVLRSNYTALSGTTETRTERYLHYLGIPLNVQYRAWEWKGFSLYISGGPMVETAVGARVETRSFVSGKPASEQWETLSCRDWFWSLNAGAGFQFRITRETALYLQPGLSWHIPGGHHIESSYTARPLSFEMDFGVRWSF